MWSLRRGVSADHLCWLFPPADDVLSGNSTILIHVYVSRFSPFSSSPKKFLLLVYYYLVAHLVGKGQPTTKLGWIHLDAEQIITLYNGINRGIQNYYRFADNFGQLVRIQYILKFSLAHTLAAKYKCSVSQIFKRFGKIPTVIIKAKDGKRDRQIAFYNNSDWKKQRNGFQIGPASVDLLRWSIKLRSRSKLGMPCCICKTSEQVEMHHVRHIRKTGGKKPAGINAILQMMNRKQIPVCTECHQKIHRGDYDGMRLSDLAYNPYESEKRRRFRESRMR